MIDFAALVLGPAMTVLGQPITVTPVKSQPNAASYAARGVYALKAVEIPMEGTDLFQQSHQPELGIKLGDFTVPPAQGDTIVCAQGTFEVFNVILDGQGGAKLVLRAIA